MYLRRHFALLALMMMVTLSSCNQKIPDVAEPDPPARPDYLTPDLRREVEALKSAVENQPTDGETLVSRADVLWRWANAYAMTGRPIHPTLPAAMGSLADGTIGRQDAGGFSSHVDWSVREYSFNDDNPDGLGELTTPSHGPYPVDTYATITQTYTVGTAPIKEGGGLLVAPRYHNVVGDFQWREPTRDGYVTAHTSNPDVELLPTDLPIYGMFSGVLGGRLPRPYFKVATGELKSGDTVTIVIGDTSQGSKGFKLPSASNDGLRFRVWVSLENPDELFNLPELYYRTVGGRTVGVRGLAPSILKAGEPLTLTIRNEDAFRNRATSGFLKYDVMEGKEVIARAHDDGRGIQNIEGIRLAGNGAHFLTIRSTDGSVLGEFNPILVEEDPDERIYWGETHGHSGFAEGNGTVDGFFKFAREDAKLDFMTLSEHDIWMDDYEWDILRNATIRDNDPGEFITFLGYEWTTLSAMGGHHNVLFRTPEDRKRVPRQEAPFLDDLYAQLKAEHEERDVLVIPHAHMPGQWWKSDPQVERLVEITSNHGTFEWLGRAYLASGYRLGFIGGSDDHIGHPGLRPISTSGYQGDNFGGLAAVMASEKSRDAIFDAMRNRGTYATNGMRIILKTTVNDRRGRQIIKPGASQIIKGRVIGTAPIDNIMIVKNGKAIHKVDYRIPESNRHDVAEFLFFSESDPYKRSVPSRGWRVWRGSLQITNGAIQGVELPNVENTYREFARISSRGNEIVEFYIRTRGAPKSIILKLKETDPATRFDLITAAGKGRSTHTFSFGAMDNENGDIAYSAERDHRDEVKARFISMPTERDRGFEFADTAPSEPGDSYYVRVTQTNGGMAWSSPVWIE